MDQNIDAELRQIIANLRTGSFCVPSLLGKYSYYDFFSHIVNGAAKLKERLPQRYFELNKLVRLAMRLTESLSIMLTPLPSGCSWRGRRHQAVPKM